MERANLCATASPAVLKHTLPQVAAPEAEQGTFTDVFLWENKKRLQVQVGRELRAGSELLLSAPPILPDSTCTTQVVDVAENTKAIRSLDWDRDRFDIEFSLDIGTTYNSYLIFGAEKTALVDASHEKFRGTYLPVLQDQLKAAGRKIDYLIVSHTEPDHSGRTSDQKSVLEPALNEPQTAAVPAQILVRCSCTSSVFLWLCQGGTSPHCDAELVS